MLTSSQPNDAERRCSSSDLSEGRIAAADVFDALTCDRVYRPDTARTPPVGSAVEWMTGERGKHCDREVLDALAGSIDEVRAVQSLLPHAGRSA